MALDTLSVDEIRTRLLAAKVVQDPALDDREGGDAWIDANAEALRLAAQQARDLEVANGILPSTATGSDLDRHAETWLGSGEARQGATVWVGAVTLTATAPVVVPIGTACRAVDGTRYKTIAAHTFAAAGSASVAADSITTGTVANKTVGAALTVESPPAGLSSAATLGATTTLAQDAESDADLRVRVLEVTARRAGAGNDADYVLWAKSEQAGTASAVTKVYVYPRWDGLNTLRILPLRDGIDRRLSAGDLALVQAYINSKRPCGVMAVCASPLLAGQQIILAITPAAGYEPDFVGTFTTAAGSTVTRINLTVNPTGTINPGDFVQVPVGALTAYAYREVAAVAASYIDLVVAVGTAPDAGLTVYPGGPLYAPLSYSLLALAAALGTSRSTDPAFAERYPNPDDEDPPELLVARIVKAAMDTEGVANVVVTLPAADITNAIAVGTSPTLIVGAQTSYVTWV